MRASSRSGTLWKNRHGRNDGDDWPALRLGRSLLRLRYRHRHRRGWCGRLGRNSVRRGIRGQRCWCLYRSMLIRDLCTTCSLLLLGFGCGRFSWLQSLRLGGWLYSGKYNRWVSQLRSWNATALARCFRWEHLSFERQPGRLSMLAGEGRRQGKKLTGG